MTIKAKIFLLAVAALFGLLGSVLAVGELNMAYIAVILASFLLLFYLLKYENVTLVLNPISSFSVFYIFLNCLGILFIGTYDYVLKIEDKTVVLFIFGLVMFLLGHTFNTVFLKKEKLEPFTDVEVQGTLSYSQYRLALLMFLAGVVLSLIYFKLVGGIPMRMVDADNARVVLKQGKGSLFIIIYALFLNSTILLGIYLQQKKRMYTAILLMLVSVALILGIGYRGQAFKVILGFYLVYTYVKYKRIKIVRSALIALVLLFALGLLGYFRSSGELIFSNLSGVWMVNRWRLFANLYNAQLVISTFDAGSLLHGQSYVMDFKTILPGYQPSFSLWLKDYMHLQFSGGGLTPTIVGEFYANFGSAGVLAGMFALGKIFSDLKLKYLRPVMEPYAFGLLIIIAITSISIVSSGLSAALLFDIIPNVLVFKAFFMITERKG